MVGDRPETDGLFASVIGASYAQVRTGVVPLESGSNTEMAVAADVVNLAALADLLLG
jgi:ribonucleotide monophosphatase NagD (HAD superfamily)